MKISPQQQAIIDSVQTNGPTKVIDGKTFEIQPMTTSEQLKVGAVGTKVIIPLLGSIQDIQKALAESGSEELDLTLAASAFSDIVTAMEPDELAHFCKALLNGVKVDSMVIDYEQYFRGKHRILFEVLFFAMQENYPDVFTAMGLGTEES